MQKIKNIEALRFLFILSIIACHLNQGITNVIDNCNLTTGFICTDTLIILDSPLCEGVFRSEN